MTTSTIPFLSFNVDNSDYGAFITDIREKIGHSKRHGFPVLIPEPARPETPENMAWLDIRLVITERFITQSITARLDRSNLYLRGYRRDADGSFWELSDTFLIESSRSLCFPGSYKGGLETKARTRREDLPLGHKAFHDAILYLADFEVDPTPNLANTDDLPAVNLQKPAWSLLVLTQMICEATRFIAIAEHISDHWHQGVKLNHEMLAMENRWAQLCDAVQRIMAPNPDRTTPLPGIPAENPSGVDTLGVARRKVGVLLHRYVEKGRTLMNLEYVRVNYKTGKLSGTIKVNDGWYTYTLYNRSLDDPEIIMASGQCATLTDDPCYSHAIPGGDAFVISLDLLFDASSSPPPNKKIDPGVIVWDRLIESESFAQYDQHLRQIVSAGKCSFHVGYSVISNALSVTIQVLLKNGDGPTEVYGTVVASQVLGGSEGLFPITLFKRTAEDHVQVRKGEAIPLTRSVFAGSTSPPLTITMHLDGIADGSMDFTVEAGPQTRTCGGVEVTITCE